MIGKKHQSKSNSLS